MNAVETLLNNTLHSHLAWAGPLLGLLTFGESLAFVGAVVPATAVMVVAGGLCAGGVIDPVSIIFWCLMGAILGDALSYWLGRRLGPVAFRHRWLRPQRRQVARTRLFFKTSRLPVLLLYRFTGPVRAFVPLIAGMSAMTSRRFQALNVISAVVWVPLMLAPGYLAAVGLKLGAGVVSASV
ncbi:DedA family protein [Brevundimonas sp.]|uniref:DedA family protein n=1 Tax=Brevundimonas sp. TaxID=1871086 RepID=UPI0035B4FA0E